MDKKNDKQKIEINKGDVVYLTRHYAEWMKMLKGDLDISLIHRIAKIVKVLDWDTEEGKALLQQREYTGKWENINSKDFKYVLKIYYPDLIPPRGKKSGLSGYEVLPRNFPNTEYPLFDIYPKHLLDDIFKKDVEDIFKIKLKGV